MDKKSECEYCTGNVDDRKSLLINDFLDTVYIDGNNMLTGDDSFNFQYDTKINYCPICGRKL